MIRVLDDALDLAETAAAAIADAARLAVDARGRCVMALAGGSTPVDTYRVLARRLSEDLPWGSLHLLWGDERLVPQDHPDSNYGMVRRELLVHVPIPEGNIHRVRTEAESVEAAAEDYEAQLRDLLEAPDGTTPRLDLVLLGLGVDGHTASLMPGCDAIYEMERLVAWCRMERLDHPRVTLTVPVLNAARRVLFLVSGGEKAAVVRAVLEGPRQPHRLPAQLVRPTGGEPDWLLDVAAARGLSPELKGRP